MSEQAQGMKDVVLLGGPNGAGKTTAAQSLVPKKLGLREFVNADEIARGLSPFNIEGAAFSAGRLMIERMRNLVHDGRSFVFETTCSGRAHAALLRRCKKDGWRVTVIYLWLPTPEAALERVARRVLTGGHGIPPETVVRRYWAGLTNMREIYLPLADVVAIYDNSDDGRVPIAEKAGGDSLVVRDPARWARISGEAK